MVRFGEGLRGRQAAAKKSQVIDRQGNSKVTPSLPKGSGVGIATMETEVVKRAKNFKLHGVLRIDEMRARPCCGFYRRDSFAACGGRIAPRPLS